jgi:hypothetical protein
VVLVDVAAADAHAAHAQQHLVGADLRHRHLAQLDGAVLERELHDRGHRGGHGATEQIGYPD